MKNGWLVVEIVFAVASVALLATKLIYKEKAIFCGGLAAIQCPAGYTCNTEAGYPDAGGNCVKGR